MNNRPQHPLSRRWHISAEGEVFGPYTGYELRDMVYAGQFDPGDFSLAEGSTEWVVAESDPILSRLFAKPVPRSAKMGALKSPKRWKIASALAIVICLSGWITWPYYSLYSLITAAKNADILALESGVDWDLLRQGVKSDLNAYFLKNNDRTSDESPASKFGAGLALLFTPSIINQTVDSLLTPAGIADGMQKERTPLLVGNKNATFIGELKEFKFEQIDYAFFKSNPFTFVVQVTPRKDDIITGPVTAVFKFSGAWKLTRIYLSPANIAASLNRKTKIPPELKQESKVVTIELIYKGFEQANLKAREFAGQLKFVLEFKNISDRDIRAFDGNVVFADIFDNQVLSMKLDANTPVPANKIYIWNGSLSYNQFLDSHVQLQSLDMQNIKTYFVLRKVWYADGSTQEF